jgi:PAS domain S-box-containing protein
MEPDMFRVAMEAAPSPMLAVAEDGSMAMVNHAAGKLLGYEVSELIGQPVELLLPEGLKVAHQQHRASFNSNPDPRPMGEERDLCHPTGWLGDSH